MKNRKYQDYMILFNQPSGRKMRNIQRKSGTVLFWEMVMILAGLAVILVCFIASGDVIPVWFQPLFSVVFVMAMLRESREVMGMFLHSEKKNLFFRTVPGRNEVLKKAMISAEVNRFLCILVFCVFTSGFSENIRLYDMILYITGTYIICVMWISFKRMNDVGAIVLFLIFISFFILLCLMDGTIEFIILENIRKIAAVFSVPAAAVTGFYLNRWTYRSLCRAGGEKHE